MPSTLTIEIPEAFGFLLEPELGEVRYRVAYGGRGSAKSWQFARAALIHGARRPLRVLCAREYQSSIKDSVHRLLEEQAQKIGLEAFYEVLQAEIRGRNGTQFIFKGLRRNVQEVKSTEGIDICWVEEAEAVSDESWRVLIPTVRKERSEIWVSFNPALESDPTYQRFVEEQPARSIVRRVGYRDNPWLPDVLREEARELQKRDPEAYAHVWGGEPWRRSEAEVLSGKWSVDEFEPAEHWDGPYYGADWGFARDPTVLVRCWVGDGRLMIDHDERGVQWSMDEIARRFRRVPGAEEHTIRADSARPETINEVSSRGLRVKAADKWSGSVKDGVEHLRSYEEIVIHPRCKGLITEARMWSYKTDSRTGDVLPKLKDGHDHGWDAVRYALGPLIRAPRKIGIYFPGMEEGPT